MATAQMKQRLSATPGGAILLLILLLAQRSPAATPANASSPLGINLIPVNYYSPEQPFLDIFKTSAVAKAVSAGWVTHSESTWDTHEAAYLQLDKDGYPTSLKASATDPNSPQLFTSVGLLLLRNLPRANAGTGLPYRPGRYVVLYEGEGTLSYGLDAKLVKSAPGRDVINVTTPTWEGGIDLRIVATDPHDTGNHLRNIRVVKAEEEALLKRGQIFRPDYLGLLSRFRIVRGINWLNIDGDGGSLQDWSNRPLLTDGGWGSDRGVPLEVLLQLCVAVGADCWLNVPHQASDDYMKQMARLTHATLGREQKAYVEFSNEVWNSSYPQYDYATQHGRTVWPAASASGFDLNRSWYGMRTAQMCDIWKSVWGADAARVVCVLSGQAEVTNTAIQSLNCPLWRGTQQGPCVNHHIDAVAIAPYFGYSVPDSWTSQPDGGLARLFASMTERNDPSIPEGGWLTQMSRFEASYRSALAPYKLELIGYEGGQSFVGHPRYRDGAPLVNLYIAANRDARMGAAYTTALNDWRKNGGHAWVMYADIYAPSQYGEWGALESFLDTVDPLSKAPPKWQALQRFIASNPCWWSGCTGSIASAAVGASRDGPMRR
jgi:hypothetical protein